MHSGNKETNVDISQLFCKYLDSFDFKATAWMLVLLLFHQLPIILYFVTLNILKCIALLVIGKIVLDYCMRAGTMHILVHSD